MALEDNAGGDAGELAALFLQYRLPAFRFALQMLGNREDAMDITQEAFIRLHRHWHRRDAGRPFAPWLYAILRNLAIDLLRQRRRHAEDGAEGIELRPSPAAGPEVLADQDELRRRVWAAIDSLPAAQREAVILRDLHGLTYAEMAQALGVPTSTVAARLHDARTALRRKLEKLL
jgi:RNA polymerase sigma-70 factor, ECF subfamily